MSPPAPASGPAVASLPPERTRGLTPPARRDGEHATHVRAVLRQVAAQPRPAGYALDGQAVRRTIDMADYSMSLVAVDDLLGCEHHAIARPAEAATPSRRIAIPDPLQVLLEDFVARVASAEPPPADATLLDRLRLLDAVYRAAREQLASTTVDVRTADTAVAPGM